MAKKISRGRSDLIADIRLDLRVRHLSDALLLLRCEKLANIVALLSSITGVEKSVYYRMSYADLRSIIDAIARIVSDDSGAVKKRVVIGGREFKLVSPYAITTGWVIDYELVDRSRFEHIAALLYYDGEKYSEGNFFERCELLKDLPVADFLAANRFFFLNYKAFTGMIAAMRMIRRVEEGLT